MLRAAATLLLGALAAPAATSRVAVGEPAPSFAVSTWEGKRLDIGALRGKRVLVFMWASW